MTSSTFLFDCYSPRGERFPLQGSKYLHKFLSEQPNEGIDWRVVARPLPSDTCRRMWIERSYWYGEYFVAFQQHWQTQAEMNVYHEPVYIAMLTASEIGQELGGN
jgi:hypothetical protein